MEKRIVIKVRNLSKKFKINGTQAHSTFRMSIINVLKIPFKFLFLKQSKEQKFIWALKNVSFDIKEGEVVGIIGKNGAGKSTLLKILSRITEPTTGDITIKGKVASLLEVGTGFSPELSGRENIYLNGSILGMTKKEIDEKFKDIVEFSGIRKFIDTPVKKYSSGMYVRLAFSIAAHLEPDILLVDEILAVGDTEFQKKCIKKMKNVASGGRTVLFVSHNLSIISSICQRTVLLSNGKKTFEGLSKEAIERYTQSKIERKDVTKHITFSQKDFDDNCPIILKSVKTLDIHNKINSIFTNLEPIKIEFEFYLKKSIPHIRIGFEIKNENEITIFRTMYNDIKEIIDYSKLNDKKFCLIAEIPGGLLNGGEYYIDLCVGLHDKKWIIKEFRTLKFKIQFNIPNKNYNLDKREGYVAPILKWMIKKEI